MKEERKFFTVGNMVFTALFAALICIASPFSIQAGPIPITLATFAVMLSGTVLGGKRGMAAVVVYILIGAVGLPVFSGFKGGLGVLFGATGGYIIGYIPLVFISGVFANMNTKINRVAMSVIGMVLGTVALYTFGTAWFMFISKSDLANALTLCALPCLPGDTIKIVCVSAVSVPLRARLSRALLNSGTKQS